MIPRKVKEIHYYIIIIIHLSVFTALQNADAV